MLPTNPKAKDYELRDGTVFNSDQFIVGGTMMQRQELDNVPVAAGEYELKGGTKFTIGIGGIILSITESDKGKTPEQLQQERTKHMTTAFQLIKKNKQHGKTK